jgi:hypothetical protein
MQLTHGLVVWLGCGLLCACGATEHEGDSDDAGTAGATGGSASPAGGAAASGGHTSTSAGSAGIGQGGGGGSAIGGSATSIDLSATDKTKLFEQAPHCDANNAYLLEGSIDGVAVHDGSAGFTGGFSNGNNGEFSTPSGVAAMDTRVRISFEWTHGLSYGQASTISNGTVIAPTGHPRAGVELCVTQGSVGFPEGGAEDGNFKFWLHATRLGPNCTGAEVAIDLRGCMN